MFWRWEGSLSLRVVPAYRHLGVMVHAGSHVGLEVASRRATVNVGTAALSKPCLRRSALPVESRVHVASLRFHSRYLHFAG